MSPQFICAIFEQGYKQLPLFDNENITFQKIIVIRQQLVSWWLVFWLSKSRVSILYLKSIFKTPLYGRPCNSKSIFFRTMLATLNFYYKFSPSCPPKVHMLSQFNDYKITKPFEIQMGKWEMSVYTGSRAFNYCNQTHLCLTKL